jgi:glycosyltransferase involved in cell wall biosynthesis
MMHARGHEIYHYGTEGSEVDCTEHITVVSADLHNKVYSYDREKEFFKFGHDEAYISFRDNAIREIGVRKQYGDFILAFWGTGVQEVCEPFNKECIVVEPGIGYMHSSCFAKHKIFESYTWMHYCYGQGDYGNGTWYDAVIPNYFDPEEFEYKEEKQDYFLYLGRVMRSKGVHIAAEVTKKINAKLILAGQGVWEEQFGGNPLPDHVEHVGWVGVEKRKQLLANAKALFVPTCYVEPFGGVTIEALMSGTPVITTDWGVFSETNLHGLTGYRCRTFDHFLYAAENVSKIDPKVCREWAIKNYSLERVREMYEEHFTNLSHVWHRKGWYEENPERENMNWLSRYYPEEIFTNEQ